MAKVHVQFEFDSLDEAERFFVQRGSGTVGPTVSSLTSGSGAGSAAGANVVVADKIAPIPAAATSATVAGAPATQTAGATGASSTQQSATSGATGAGPTADDLKAAASKFVGQGGTRTAGKFREIMQSVCGPTANKAADVPEGQRQAVIDALAAYAG